MTSNRTIAPTKKSALTGARAEGGLTQRQEAFCLGFVETCNASEAYRRAYQAKRMSAKTIHECASRLLADRKVSARVAELRGKAADKAVLTLEGHLAELDRLKALAEAKENFPAAIRAEELRGKVAGYYVHRAMVVKDPLEGFNQQELREFYAILKARQEARKGSTPADVVH